MQTQGQDISAIAEHYLDQHLQKVLEVWADRTPLRQAHTLPGSSWEAMATHSLSKQEGSGRGER